jgi:hypothetical protein
MGAFDPSFSPNEKSIKWQTGLKILWGIDIALLIVGQVLAFSILTLIINLVLLFFYFWNWKTLNVVGTAFGIVFKTLGLIAWIFSLWTAAGLYSLLNSTKYPPGHEQEQ